MENIPYTSDISSLGGDYNTAYIDVKDAQWLSKGDLKPVDVNSISASQFVIYRFGVFIIKLLHQNIGTPEVSVITFTSIVSVLRHHSRKIHVFCWQCKWITVRNALLGNETVVFWYRWCLTAGGLSKRFSCYWWQSFLTAKQPKECMSELYL